MKTSVRYSEEYDCLFCQFEGDLDLESSRAYVKVIAELAGKHECYKCVNDLSKAIIKVSIADLFYFPKLVNVKGFDNKWRRAVIVKDKGQLSEFYEVTAKNQGLNVKVFLSIEQALEWLN